MNDKLQKVQEALEKIVQRSYCGFEAVPLDVKNLAEQALAELKGVTDGLEGWRPMEIIIKDGARKLLLWEDKWDTGMVIGRWDGERWVEDGANLITGKPIMWMPLPQKPKQ